MAIARLSVKIGKAGKAAPHADYIAREGQYASRLGRGEALEAKEAGNMPAWAADHPGRFWHAADAFERANGTTYRELELALPRELEAADRATLVREFVKQELAERHPYQWAIHRPKAADGQDQPHAHLMFSERRLDGIERDPDQFFKRYNAKAPEKGGAHKRFGEVDGPNRSQAQRAADLRALRGRWGEMVNAHLERAGVAERIDMRSLKDQGKDRAPEKKQLPSAWRDTNQRAVVLEYRQINREQDQAAAEFRAVVPEGHVVDLEAHAAKLEAIRVDIQTRAAAERAKLQEERDRNTAEIAARQVAEAAALVQQHDARQAAWLANQPALDAAEADRVARVQAENQKEFDRLNQERAARFQAIRDAHAAKLAALERPTIEAPTAPAVEPTTQEPKAAAGRPRNVGKQDPEAVYAIQLKPIQEQAQKAAAAIIEALRMERQEWNQARQAHQEAEPTIGLFGRQAKWERAGVALDQAGRDLAQREGAAAKAADPKAIERAAVAELRRTDPGVVQAAEAARKAREDLERDRKQREQEAKAEKAANERVGKDFDLLARRRESGGFGFWDHSEDWKATPSGLKDRIAEYIKLPKEQRAADLEKINRDPKTREALRGLMAERETAIRKLSRGR